MYISCVNLCFPVILNRNSLVKILKINTALYYNKIDICKQVSDF